MVDLQIMQNAEGQKTDLCCVDDLMGSIRYFINLRSMRSVVASLGRILAIRGLNIIPVRCSGMTRNYALSVAPCAMMEQLNHCIVAIIADRLLKARGENSGELGVGGARKCDCWGA